jgi:hypothetical protein
VTSVVRKEYAGELKDSRSPGGLGLEPRWHLAVTAAERWLAAVWPVVVEAGGMRAMRVDYTGTLR